MEGGGGGWCGFFLNDTATTEIYTLSLHDALPILIFGKAVHVVSKRVERSGGNHPRLPHRAPENLPVPACTANHLFRTGQRRADWGAQPFGEANRHGIKMLRPLIGRDSGGNDRVEQPSAIQMGNQAVLVGPRTDPLHSFKGKNPATASIVRILQANEPCANHVLVFRLIVPSKSSRSSKPKSPGRTWHTTPLSCAGAPCS